jgi:hypothetical protein
MSPVSTSSLTLIMARSGYRRLPRVASSCLTGRSSPASGRPARPTAIRPPPRSQLWLSSAGRPCAILDRRSRSALPGISDLAKPCPPARTGHIGPEQPLRPWQFTNVKLAGAVGASVVPVARVNWASDVGADDHLLELAGALEDRGDPGSAGSFRTHRGPYCQEGMANSPGDLARGRRAGRDCDRGFPRRCGFGAVARPGVSWSARTQVSDTTVVSARPSTPPSEMDQQRPRQCGYRVALTGDVISLVSVGFDEVRTAGLPAGMHARLRRSPPPENAASAAVRGRPWKRRRCTPTVVTLQTDRPYSTDARPLCVRGPRNTTPYSATR